MSQDIQSHLRQAVAHERAANSADDKYEQQMKAAGYETWTAFCMAARAAPERSGRRSEDADLLKLYHTPGKRQWWDDELAKLETLKVKDKKKKAAEWIQWHLEPTAAQKERGRDIAQKAGARLKNQQPTQSRSPRGGQAGPTDAELERVVDAIEAGTTADYRAPAMLEQTKDVRRDDMRATVRDLVSSIINLADKASTEDGELAIETLRAVKADLQRAVSQVLFG